MSLQIVSLPGISVTVVIDECRKKGFGKIGFITLGGGGTSFLFSLTSLLLLLFNGNVLAWHKK